jgi:hypothetical protein
MDLVSLLTPTLIALLSVEIALKLFVQSVKNNIIHQRLTAKIMNKPWDQKKKNLIKNTSNQI